MYVETCVSEFLKVIESEKMQFGIINNITSKPFWNKITTVSNCQAKQILLLSKSAKFVFIKRACQWQKSR